jgi:hypothetical protein
MPKHNVHPAVARARARLAGLTARKADPDTIAAARAQLAEANAAADISKWPPMAALSRARLASLILVGGGDDAAP